MSRHSRRGNRDDSHDGGTGGRGWSVRAESNNKGERGAVSLAPPDTSGVPHAATLEGALPHASNGHTDAAAHEALPDPMDDGGVGWGEQPADGYHPATSTPPVLGSVANRRPSTPLKLASATSNGRAPDAEATPEPFERRSSERPVEQPEPSISATASAASVDLSHGRPDQAAIALLDETNARRLVAMPLALDPDGTVVIVAAEATQAVATELSQRTGRQVRLVVAHAADIQRTIDRCYRAKGEIDRYVKAFEATDTGRRAAPAEDVTSDEAPIVRIVSMMITQALRDRASDIHIEPQDQELRVRFRIDGALVETLTLPITMASALVSRIKIMAGMNIVERRRSQDGQMTLDIDGRTVDIRVATTAVIWGEKCVMRVLDKSRALYKLSDLGMPEDTHATYGRILRAPFGMVLCAGPTGSGKTTSLYASLAELNDPTRNIMTIEDPVEYVVPSINQIQTNEQAGLTFATGLRSILRQDPDAILVGEIRDVETARVAIQSALTGHFVLSSLHATDAVAALHRFLDMGIESFLIASSVLAVIGQRLVRRICDVCKAPYTPGEEELAFYEEAHGPEKTVFYRGEGCNLCAGTGYEDRIGVYEFLRITPEIKRLIVGWATQDELRRLAIGQGMRTLRDEALTLVAHDITTIAEVMRSVYVV